VIVGKAKGLARVRTEGLLRYGTSRLAWLPNNALKLTRSHGRGRMEALRATMRRLSGPLQLNAMFVGRVSTSVGRSE
jgi:hypothetical protein